MKSPSAIDLIRVWELGRDRPAWFRGLLLLGPAYPDKTFDRLAQMTIGQRNIGLFRLRERLFGSRLSAVVRCPHCEKPSEFSARVDEVCPHELPAEIPASPEFRVDIDGVSVTCRCPTSLDLAALGDAPDDAVVSTALVARCVEPGSDEPLSLPANALEAVLDATYAHDPQLGLALEIECSECGHHWSSRFDCVAFLWAEVGAAVERLLDDVHVLASAYGWRESDILAMSAARRGFYLERAAR